MAIYLSAGPSTIAALMVVDRMTANASPETHTDLGTLCDCEAADRRCEQAVLTAYQDLRLHGTPQPSALEACATLYRTHHPDASPTDARTLITAWLQDQPA